MPKIKPLALTEQKARQMLVEVGARATPNRIAVLMLLLDSEWALSHQDIEQLLLKRKQDVDRVTLYRTLDWLVEHAVAHKISGDDRIWRFNAPTSQLDEHAHFFCNNCGKVFCIALASESLPVRLPAHYRLASSEVVLKGQCPACRA
ncbi:MAG: transcriptional repressor [Gammaproteobacteria bacterium]|nr:transcriptional repressor [Gammaproteobacteria bacterium]